MRAIYDLPESSVTLFIKRHKDYINTNVEDIENGLHTRIENTTDTLKEIGLRYNEQRGKLESHFGIINDLSIVVELSTNYGGTLHNFDLQFEEERENLGVFLNENPNYVLTYFDSEVFNHDEDTDMNDVLETYNYLSMLNTEQQELFADVFVNGYGDSPIDLVSQLIYHLKDW